MLFETHGTIDISPPLLWSEVRTLGFMVANSKGVPQVPAGRWIELVADDEIVNRPEGSLHRYTFAAMREAAVEVPLDQREAMRLEVETIVNSFPANTFGGVDRAIRFRGNELDDIWRIRVNPDRTVVRQVAQLNWVAPSALSRKFAVSNGLPLSHCGELEDHRPHQACIGGPYAAPGNTKMLGAT